MNPPLAKYAKCPIPIHGPNRLAQTAWPNRLGHSYVVGRVPLRAPKLPLHEPFHLKNADSCSSNVLTG